MKKIVINLTIKSKWFNMICNGQKLEEYRPCYNKQVANAFDQTNEAIAKKEDCLVLLILRNGYSLNSRSIAVILCGFERRPQECVSHPEWGEPYMSHFVMKIGGIVDIGTYKSVKAFVGCAKQETPLLVSFPRGPSTFDGIKGKWINDLFVAQLDDQEAKPCPFCGGRPKMERRTYYGWYICCSECGCAHQGGVDGQDALANWNTRHDVEWERGVE